MGLKAVVDDGWKQVDLYTDNMTTLFFIKKGTAGFLYPLAFHFFFIKILNFIHLLIKINPRYINTKDNPADYFSRIF